VIRHNGKIIMSALTFDDTATASNPAAQRSEADAMRIAALGLLSVRFIQGFIYWGGGSRRFIYAPAKLDPNAASWMANKFQSAMPGALLGTDHIIAFLLHHFYLLYVSLILFSAAELITGLFLMTGFLTRAAALVSIGLSVVLMLMFGWQGATCIDEWTMAACNLAIGATLCLAAAAHFRSTARCWRASQSSPRATGFAGCPEPCRFRYEAEISRTWRWRCLRRPSSLT
jgi:thiosulfate dehydrogenase (quinone)